MQFIASMIPCRYTGFVRVLGLVLAVAVSPLGSAVCQMVCSGADEHHPAREASVCHDEIVAMANLTAEDGDSCLHVQSPVVLTKAPVTFDLSVWSALRLSNPVVIRPQLTSFLGTAPLPPISPPPLVLPLRI